MVRENYTVTKSIMWTLELFEWCKQ